MAEHGRSFCFASCNNPSGEGGEARPDQMRTNLLVPTLREAQFLVLLTYEECPALAVWVETDQLLDCVWTARRIPLLALALLRSAASMRQDVRGGRDRSAQARAGTAYE